MIGLLTRDVRKINTSKKMNKNIAGKVSIVRQYKKERICFVDIEMASRQQQEEEKRKLILKKIKVLQLIMMNESYRKTKSI